MLHSSFGRCPEREGCVEAARATAYEQLGQFKEAQHDLEVAWKQDDTDESVKAMLDKVRGKSESSGEEEDGSQRIGRIELGKATAAIHSRANCSGAGAAAKTKSLASAGSTKDPRLDD